MLDLSFGDRTVAAERLHALAGLQNTIYDFAKEASEEGPIYGYTDKFFYRFDMDKKVDVLTITHSSGLVETLTFRDGAEGKALWELKEGN